MELKIITPDELAFSGEVYSVTVPGSAGAFEVLKDHAPIISTLNDGQVIIRSKQAEQTIVIKGGVIEVLNNQITVLAEGIKKAVTA